MLKVILSFISITIFFFTPLFTQDKAEDAPVLIPRLDSSPKIDARLDEDCWKNACQLDLKYETQPAENQPAPVKTDVFIFYNKTHVYFALICYDPDPSAIRARYHQRDRFGSDDLVNINLDTFNDERQNYFLGVNPLGVQRDGTEQIRGSNSWDAIWDAAGRITDQGYIIEMSIPFASLKFPRKKGKQIWGLDISRWYPREYNRRLGLVKIDRNNNTYQSQFLKIIGFEDVKPGKSIEIIPTLTGTKTEERDPFPDGDYQSISSKFEPGLTVQWGITNNMTVNATVNPDFSQVEADSRQLDINQQFALYFEEKRPFFTEGSDYFNTPFDAIHTRTMRDPKWGVKLSGKEKGNTVGFYFVRDDVTNLMFPGSQSSSQTALDQESTATILRYKRDLGSKYTIGALVTNREGGDYFNRVFGFDGEARFTPKHRLQLQFLGTSTQYPLEIAQQYDQPLDSFNDRALSVEYNYDSRNFSIYAGYQDVGKDFRADLGYMPQVDYRMYGPTIEYRWIKSDSWWSQAEIGMAYFYSTDHDNNFLNEMEELFFNMQGIMQSSFFIEVQRSREAYNGETFELYKGNASFDITPLPNLSLSFDSKFGDYIDYSNSRKAKRFQLEGSAGFNMGRRFKVEVDHFYEKLNVNEESLYTANISQGSLVYHFNTRMFVKGILQYVDYKYNVDNYTYPIDPRYKDLFTQFLFSYRLNPRTVLFLGYTGSYQGNREIPLTQLNRTLFMKLSYSWQI